MVNDLNKELKVLELIKKYVGIKEDPSDDLFEYQIFDKQYVSLRSCLLISKEDFEILKEFLCEEDK